MPAWKILITDGLEENGQSILRADAQVDDRSNISADDLLKIIAEYDALIVRGRTKVTAAVFAAAPQLKVVGRAGVGVDNIDLKAAREHQVTVVNSPNATTVAVAELAMSLILGLVREIPRADASMKAGKWIKKDLEGCELYGKTLGVIGFGRIGTAFAKRAEAFGMKILAVDTVLKVGYTTPDGYTVVAMDEMLQQADFISLHLPLTDSTRNLLSHDQFAKMKDGVRIVNAARGGVVDEQALLEALESGKVAGAALDVFATEPTTNTALVQNPRVICTPHIGAQTVEAQARAAVDISNEILAALRGDALRWKVA